MCLWMQVYISMFKVNKEIDIFKGMNVSSIFFISFDQ